MNSRRLCSDTCAKEAKDNQNDSIINYDLYQYLHVPCDGAHARFPSFAYDHVNLTGRTGYGVAEGCVVDNYSMLRNDPAQMTRDKCKTQLFTRIFQGAPNLGCGMGDPEKELNVLSGSSSSTFEGTKFPCKKSLMEKQLYHFDPLLDCVKQVQAPKHIVEQWTRGGTDTRNYMLRQEMLKDCGVGLGGNNAQFRG
jgi:hypothetical protein